MYAKQNNLKVIIIWMCFSSLDVRTIDSMTFYSIYYHDYFFDYNYYAWGINKRMSTFILIFKLLNWI